jgi:hypothetical protein
MCICHERGTFLAHAELPSDLPACLLQPLVHVLLLHEHLPICFSLLHLHPLDVPFVFLLSHVLFLNLAPHQFLLLYLHLVLHTLHHNIVLKTHVVIILLLVSLKLLGLQLLHSLLVICIDTIIYLGLVHDLIEALR